ncbi:hypothetical protein LOTGIDRAFT_233566 [Lottia gigantea]|uniref:Coiled-coil domain-containing protein 172 n=1 Tax=Lottia gigantea TaxID=225164 RepID=V4BQD5_LOTGI|nr:hypothetical protein LOTGIDRAFT_233566 [Lottia gigantea]ESO91089.1 hypothetical protein LOTGIDRAFT_233566 [Lottia gigantea]
MTSTLNDLFDQIIHSERLAQERKSHLFEVKAKIQSCQEKLLTTKEEWESQRGRQVLKIKQLNEEELKLKWLTNRELILLEQKNSTIEERKEIDKQMEDVLKTYDENLQCFMNDISQTMVQYDLTGHGIENRELELQDELNQLDKQQQKLSVDVDEYDSHVKEIENLCEKKSNLGEILEELNTKKNEKSQELSDTLNSLSNLEKEKIRVSQIPQNDPEFCRLRSEVNYHMNNELEEQYQKLQQEVSELQHALRHKQIHKQKKLKPERKQSSFYDKFEKNSTDTDTRCSQISSSSQSKRLSFLLQDVPQETQNNIESANCETSNRLCITSFPNSTTNTISQNEKLGEILNHDFDKDPSNLNTNQQRSSRSSKSIFNPKRKKMT